MSLDPDARRYLERLSALGAPPITELAPAEVRLAAEATAVDLFGPTDAVGAVFDQALPGPVRTRVYQPAGAERDLPVLVYCHGGGWVAGSLATHDGAAAALARDANAVVASVQYRRAPENPYPAPNDDAYAALAWFHANARSLDVDPRRIAVAGDSAGAHLALGCAIEARDRGGPAIAFQLLIYPVVAPEFDTSSYLAHAASPTLTREDMQGYWRAYLPPESDDGGARAVPARDTLAGLPPAHIVIAELDPLRDEGAALADRFAEAGVHASLAEATALPHGFLRAAPYAAAARAAQAALGAVARTALHR